MVLLVLETVTPRGSIALVVDGACLAIEGDTDRTHAERLPGDVMDWLARHGLGLGDVDCYSVVSGPGSFTGTRVGVAAVQGFALATGKSVIPIPTLDAVASGWLDRTQPGGAPELIVPCVDGQRGDVYFAAFERTTGTRLEDCRVVCEAQAARPDEARARLSALGFAGATVLVGDGAARYADVFTSGLPDTRAEALGVSIAEAASRLALRRVAAAASPHALRPVYLRRPDAELARTRPPSAAALAVTIELAAGPDDVSAVEALQRRSFTNAWGAESIRWELEHTDVARLYVARGAGGALVGYCACWMIFDELHLNSLAVEDAWRRRGVARQLLRRVIGDSVAVGARSGTLEVRQSNTAARGLYERFGFKVEGVRRDYYQEPREDALVLWNRQLFTPAGGLW